MAFWIALAAFILALWCVFAKRTNHEVESDLRCDRMDWNYKIDRSEDQLLRHMGTLRKRIFVLEDGAKAAQEENKSLRAQCMSNRDTVRALKMHIQTLQTQCNNNYQSSVNINNALQKLGAAAGFVMAAETKTPAGWVRVPNKRAARRGK